MSKNYVVGTKLCAMGARLLKKRDYHELIGMKSVPEVAAYLKSLDNFKEILAQMDINQVHREELEARMLFALIGDYVKLMHYYKRKNKEIFSYFVRRYEIEQLKTLLRLLGSHTDFELYIEGYPLPYSFDFQKVASAKDLKEFIEALQGSPYHRVLKQFVVNTEYLNEFDIEIRLDRYYIDYVLEKIKGKREHKQMLETFGREMDMMNLLWIYRCKKYYSISKDVIYSFIIPNYYKIDSGIIARMVEAESVDEVLNIARSTEYREIFQNQDSKFIELTYQRYMQRIFEQTFRDNKYEAIGVTSYMHLKETEIKDITAIIEGIRYGLPAEEIKKYLVKEIDK